MITSLNIVPGTSYVWCTQGEAENNEISEKLGMAGKDRCRDAISVWTSICRKTGGVGATNAIKLCKHRRAVKKLDDNINY